jgi:ABC-type sugar transport system substrate-binding protein
VHRSISAAVVTAAAALVVAAAPAAADQRFAPGSDGLGDPYFPQAGNGGYDVKHYSLDLDYERATNTLDAEATIVAKATQNLSSFNLDLRGPRSCARRQLPKSA